MDDPIRAYHAPPPVSFLAQGIRGQGPIDAVREHATPAYYYGYEDKIPIASSSFEVKTANPLTSTSTQTVFFFSDELIRSIQMDWDQGEDYIQLSMALTEGIQFQDGPIRPKDSG